MPARPRRSAHLVLLAVMMAVAGCAIQPDGDDDLGELVFEVVVEEFARLLGVSPEDIDPGYPAED